MIQNLKKTYYNFNGGVTSNTTGNNYFNLTYNVNSNNGFYDVTANNYYTKKILIQVI